MRPAHRHRQAQTGKICCIQGEMCRNVPAKAKKMNDNAKDPIAAGLFRTNNIFIYINHLPRSNRIMADTAGLRPGTCKADEKRKTGASEFSHQNRKAYPA